MMATLMWYIACGSKVFSVLLLPIFRPAGEKLATINGSYHSAEG
jgi:hypothetical protein